MQTDTIKLVILLYLFSKQSIVYKEHQNWKVKYSDFGK